MQRFQRIPAEKKTSISNNLSGLQNDFIEFQMASTQHNRFQIISTGFKWFRSILNDMYAYHCFQCISKDQKWLLASVWDPCQELFQGVIRCIHSDFRIGGLEPGEKKEIRGKMYLMKNDINAFLKIYDQEFPSNK